MKARIGWIFLILLAVPGSAHAQAGLFREEGVADSGNIEPRTSNIERP